MPGYSSGRLTIVRWATVTAIVTRDRAAPGAPAARVRRKTRRPAPARTSTDAPRPLQRNRRVRQLPERPHRLGPQLIEADDDPILLHPRDAGQIQRRVRLTARAAFGTPGVLQSLARTVPRVSVLQLLPALRQVCVIGPPISVRHRDSYVLERLSRPRRSGTGVIQHRAPDGTYAGESGGPRIREERGPPEVQHGASARQSRQRPGR